MNTSAPQVTIIDYSSEDGYNGKAFVDNTKPDDIYLNWWYLSAANDTQRRSTTGHELGHALGLDRTANAAIMNNVRDRNVIYTPKDEDIKGVNAIYGYP